MLIRLLAATCLLVAGPGILVPPADAARAHYGTAASAQEGTPAPANVPEGEVVETPYGPLSPGDRDLLVRVRFAGLWEIPAGAMAAERGTTAQVREIGEFIRDEHTALDEEAVAVADTLGVPLPDEPFAEHQSWLDRIDAAEGEDFDRAFVQLLREAHGAIYPLIAYARAGTHNDLIREFAQTAEEFVGRHLDYLESTGLVDWHHIPPPPEPAGAQSRFLASAPAGVHPALIWLLLGIATAAGVFTAIRVLRPR